MLAPLSVSATSALFNNRVLEEEKERKKSIERKKQINDNKKYLDKLIDDVEPNIKAAPSLDCFEVQKILFIPTAKSENSDLDEFSFLNQSINRDDLQCVNQKSIQNILQGLLAKLYAKGYVTTYLNFPDQSLKTGVLKIGIIPGYVRRVYSDDKELAAFLPRLFSGIEGAILKLPRT